MELQERQKLTRRLALLRSQLEQAQGDRAKDLQAEIDRVEAELQGKPPVEIVVDSVPDTVGGHARSKARARDERWADVAPLVSAPYRFVPLNEVIVAPERQGLPLDEPLAGDGSATLEVTWGIETPLLIGKSVQESGAEVVVPMHLGGKESWVVPGATLRGLVRSSLEIIAFAKLRQVNDHFRFGVRDFTHRRYRDERQIGSDQQICAGWLKKEGDDYRIEPCAGEGGDWGYVEIDGLPGNPRPESWSKKTRAEKYAAMAGRLTGFTVVGPRPLQSRMVYRPETTGRPGTFVVSDKAVGKKRYEYVFFPAASAQAIKILPGPWHEFEVMNCRQGRTRLEPDGAWADLVEQVENGEKVPVFWVGSLENQGDDFAFGLTRLFKIPHKCRVGDKIPEAHRPRLGAGGKPERDFVENLFGFVDERDDLVKIPGGDQLGNALARRSRVSFGFARPSDKSAFALWPDAERRFKTIAMAPRASYAPYYLVGSAKDWSDTDCTLAGRKRYPPRYEAANLAVAEAELRERLKDPEERIVAASREGRPPSPDVLTRLRFLRPTTTDAAFVGTIKLHNVTEIELGAVLWALTFGNDTNGLYRHMLGRAKGMGAGQTAVRRIGIVWRPHGATSIDAAWPATAADELAVRAMRAFEEYMEKATRQGWRSSETFKAYMKLHAPGTWAGMAGALANKLGESPPTANERQRVVRRWEGDRPLATSFLGRPEPVDSAERKTTNDFQRIRDATKLAYSGSAPPEPGIPDRLLTIPS